MNYAELLAVSDKQQAKIAEIEKERDEYHAMVVYMGAIMDESEGVAGYHLNGDIAKWDDLFTTSLYENAASIRDLEQQAKGLTDYAKTQEQGIAAVWIISAASKLLKQAKALKGQGE